MSTLFADLSAGMSTKETTPSRQGWTATLAEVWTATEEEGLLLMNNSEYIAALGIAVVGTYSRKNSMADRGPISAMVRGSFLIRALGDIK